MTNFLCHTTAGDCEYFQWDRGRAMCYHGIDYRHIPKMKTCPLTEKVKLPPSWKKNPNQGELFGADAVHKRVKTREDNE